MEVFIELVKQGGIAGILGWLYFQERKDRIKTQEKYESSLEARRADAKEATDNITAPLSGIAQGIKLLTDKIVLGKKQGE